MHKAYRNSMFVVPPPKVKHLHPILSAARMIKDIEQAHDDLVHDLTNNLAPASVIIITETSQKHGDSVFSITAENLLNNIVSWYQTYDEILCGEDKE